MNPSEKYWLTRLESCAKALTKNGFSAIVVDRIEDAANAAAEIIEKLAPRTIGYADSRTMHRSGILNVIRQDDRRTLDRRIRPVERTRRKSPDQTAGPAVRSVFDRSECRDRKGGIGMAGYDRQPHRGGRIRAGTRPVVHRAEQVDSDLESARQRIKTLAAPMNRPRSCDIQNALPDDRPVSRLQQSRPDLQRLVDPRKVFSERADRRHPDQRGSGLLDYISSRA